VKQNFTILDLNYNKKCREIDIIAEKGNKIYFIEAKSVIRETFRDVNHETLDNYHPEDNMHPWKMKHLLRDNSNLPFRKKYS
jgi:hypothetical protein